MPPFEPDIELVARANRGDARAFEELYLRYRGFVFRLAKQRLGNEDDAADVLQDAFLYLFRRFPGFEVRAAMTTVLYPVVIHLCQDRRMRQRPTIDIDEIELEARPGSEAKDRGDHAAALLSELRTDDRELLTLRFVEDLSLPQLSEALKVPIGTIKSRLHRAIATLRVRLGQGRKYE